jgi:hypothetical protein
VDSQRKEIADAEYAVREQADPIARWSANFDQRACVEVVRLRHANARTKHLGPKRAGELAHIDRRDAGRNAGLTGQRIDTRRGSRSYSESAQRRLATDAH